jgi:hypothetical protein
VVDKGIPVTLVEDCRIYVDAMDIIDYWVARLCGALCWR